ncbi:MAG: hypothetical protein ACFFER_13215 [Candidatus Thorarchaeota archaeon]
MMGNDKADAMLNEKQKGICLALFEDYQDEEHRSKRRGMTFDEWFENRVQVGKRINKIIDDFLSDQKNLDDFSSEIISVNKESNLWGFIGWKGRFFFMRLLTNSDKFKQDLGGLLKDAIREPKNDDDAIAKISRFYDAVEAVASTYKDRRMGPGPTSIPFFLTYFWSIQSHDKWPIQYTSTENTYDSLGFWGKTGDVVEDARNFLKLTREIHRLFIENSDVEQPLRIVGHVIYDYHLKQKEAGPGKRGTKTGMSKDGGRKTEGILSLESGLPTSYTPPVISILPQMAKIDPSVEEACRLEGKSLPVEFERRVTDAFRMLGFTVERRGQGHGREPDVIAKCVDYHYAIIIDAKARSDQYKIGTESRKFIEYIQKEMPVRGMDKVYFGIVSSDFPDRKDSAIRDIKSQTKIHGVLMFRAQDLVTLIEQKLRDPETFDLGPSGFLGLLTEDGVVDIGDSG